MFKSVLLGMFLASSTMIVPSTLLADDGDFRRGHRRHHKNRNSLTPQEASIGQATFRGTGCSNDSVGVALSPDKKTMSVLFDEYIVEAGRSVEKRRDRKTCNIVVPFRVPAGMQVAVVQMEYRGYNLLEPGAVSRFTSGFFFSDRGRGAAARQQTRRSMRFQGPVDDEYVISTDTDSRIQWSACGRNSRLNIFTSMVTATNANWDDALSTVDSLDLTSTSTEYHLLWRSCRGGRRGIIERDRDHRRRPIRQPRNPRRGR